MVNASLTNITLLANYHGRQVTVFVVCGRVIALGVRSGVGWQLVTLVLALVGGRGKESLVSLNKVCSR